MDGKKIACIGSFELFKAFGAEIYPASTPDEAMEILKKIRTTHDLILLAERLSEKMDLQEIRDEKVPLLIELPDEEGSTGAAKKRVADLISKASGIKLKGVE